MTLGEEGFSKQQLTSFPECLRLALREEGFKKKQISSLSVAPGEEFFQKKIPPNGTNGVRSSPSAKTALGEGFPECTIFGTQGRPLSRERHRRRLFFPECCTRGRLPRVSLPLPRVHLALGEASVSRSASCRQCPEITSVVFWSNTPVQSVFFS
jgi:hypothetical protein